MDSVKSITISTYDQVVEVLKQQTAVILNKNAVFPMENFNISLQDIKNTETIEV